jgi:hypothetical protein
VELIQRLASETNSTDRSGAEAPQTTNGWAADQIRLPCVVPSIDHKAHKKQWIVGFSCANRYKKLATK